MAKLGIKDKGEVARGMGTTHGAATLFLRTGMGSAQHGGCKYEVSIMPAGQPVIRSEQTGRWFVFRWNDLLEHAVEVGDIDGREPLVEGEQNV